ncbi:hypothetical protein AX14_008572 [Amanita brunnescens Koide BX004]|nr:hypothetical protein AX14_008572 [Amanita brunnescens Koide BX004]
MDLVNVGRLHQFQPQNDSEARAMRGILMQKREALESIEREIAQLVENKTGIEEDIVRLGVALAPHNHNRLPNEVLGHIFILLALEHGAVRFPIQKHNYPPQLVVSHVCSHWRRVALRTPELWSDTDLIYPRNGPRNHLICLHHRWLFRARTFPITLRIQNMMLDDSILASALQDILFPIQVKRLRLSLTWENFMALSTLPEAVLSGLSEFELDLTFNGGTADVSINDQHPLITRLRSVTFHSNQFPLPLSPNLPWNQLRSLNFDADIADLQLIFGILRQTPMLEALSLEIFHIDVSEELTMPSLRTFVVVAADLPDVDKILRSFKCPSLTKFSLNSGGRWTSDTFDILKRQYNMKELREADITGNFPLPISSLLQEAPILRSFSLGKNAIMDDEAVIGISNGTLGRFLRRLVLRITCDVGEVLDMVEARKKTVDGMIKSGCSWREELTILKDIGLLGGRSLCWEYSERIRALNEIGISIRIIQ